MAPAKESERPSDSEASLSGVGSDGLRVTDEIGQEREGGHEAQSEPVGQAAVELEGSEVEAIEKERTAQSPPEELPIDGDAGEGTG
jgi:hypothetical protein